MNVDVCRIINAVSLFFFGGIWVPCSDIIYYWGSSAGYQQGKWDNVNKKWVCGSALSRDYCLLALQHMITCVRNDSLFFILCNHSTFLDTVMLL